MTETNLNKFCSEWLAAWTGNRPQELRAFYTEDAYYSDPARPQGLRGPEILPYFTKLLARNPSWRWEAAAIYPTQEGFCLKWRATIPKSDGTSIHKEGMDLVELRAGRISRNEVFFDPSNL